MLISLGTGKRLVPVGCSCSHMRILRRSLVCEAVTLPMDSLAYG
jgi:hypothetical protein